MKLRLSSFKIKKKFNFRLRNRLFSYLFILPIFLFLFTSCQSDNSEPQALDTDGDGILDEVEVKNGTNKGDPCSPLQESGYTGFNASSVSWINADCDNDGTSNGDELDNDTDPFFSDILDTDGDGITDAIENTLGSDVNNPCSPKQGRDYTGYDTTNEIWGQGDCDGDGTINEEELTNSTNPYFSDVLDTDGDGVPDAQEESNGTNLNDPCDPVQDATYTIYNAENEIWSQADCDGDGTLNGEEETNDTNPYFDDTLDTDGDGITDAIENTNGTDINNPCDPIQEAEYDAYDVDNTIWSQADCDSDGTLNGEEAGNGTDPYFDDTLDTDGDGVTDAIENTNGTDVNNPCDPIQEAEYDAYDVNNTIWSQADCDSDGTLNGVEAGNGTDPYFDDTLDTDGDGVTDAMEIANDTDINNPCDPTQVTGYTAYDADNTIWSLANCDGDEKTNGEEHIAGTNPYGEDIVYPATEFLPNLSEMNIFKDQLSDLVFNSTVYEYSLATPLFTDYSKKMRGIGLPMGEVMQYNGEGLLTFPDNTVLVKTFYYYTDERNLNLGKKIIETRILIKKNGNWTFGNYVWNASQTEAVLDANASTQPVTWINSVGETNSITYEVPSNTQCMQCHWKDSEAVLIGPKARNLNFIYKGNNQLQFFINEGLLVNAPSVNSIAVLPTWWDTSFSLDERARAYLDVNCAHCHQPGGSAELAIGNSFEFRYETSYDDTNINDVRSKILQRIHSSIDNYRMPLIGTSIPHVEGVDLINEYINSLY